MQEIAPGIHHWTTFHPGIRMNVCSYFVEPAGVVIDPMVPEDGLDAFDGFSVEPQQALLTIRHHYRGCDAFVERFGLTVACHASGLHEFEGTDRSVEGFEGGDEVAPGVTAIATDAISDDDVTFHIAHGDGALAFGDGLVRPPGGSVGFVPDGLIGEDPASVKAALYDAYRGLLERDFDTLLFAHGEPLVGGGYSALKEFVSAAY